MRLGVADVDDQQHGAIIPRAAGRPRAGPLDPVPSAASASASARPSGQRQPGVELEQRDEHEPPGDDLGMRQRQPLGLVARVAEQQHVDVDRPRAVAHAAGLAAERALDCLARVEQRLRAERGLDRRQAL